MKFLVGFTDFDPTYHYVEADSVEDACNKLGIRIADPEEAEVVGRYHLEGDGVRSEVYFEELNEVSSSAEALTLLKKMMSDWDEHMETSGNNAPNQRKENS